MFNNINQIYCNHIPRTGGTYLLKNILLSNDLHERKRLSVLEQYTLEKKFMTLKKQDFLKANLIAGHYGIAPQIINSKIISTTILRNPLMQTISLFCKLFETYKDTEQFKDIFNINSNEIIKVFDYWVNTKDYKNYQSKNLIDFFINSNVKDNKIIPSIDIDSLDKINSQEMNIDNLKILLKKYQLIGTTENIEKHLDAMFNLINDTFSLNLINYRINYKVNSSELSSYIYNNINKYHKNLIIDNTELDFEAWEYAKTLT